MYTSEMLANYLYNKLPNVYRSNDTELESKPLYRYLLALIDGGFISISNSIVNTMDLIDPQKCPSEFLPYLCESFGLEYYEDIDILYQRRFLANIGEIFKRRGTYSCVTYLVRALTGLSTELEYLRGEYKGQQGRHLIINLIAPTLEDAEAINNYIRVIGRYVREQIPYYITLQFVFRIEQRVEHLHYNSGILTSYLEYKIGGK